MNIALDDIRSKAPEGAEFYNDEFEENGDIVYLRRNLGILQYYDYKGEWSELLFNMPYKPLN